MPGADDIIAGIIDGAPPAPVPDGAPPEKKKRSRAAASRRHSSPNEEASTATLEVEGERIHQAAIAACALLDHSDTDNGKRLRAYYGSDLTVLALEEAAGGAFLGWTGTHWDMADGAALAQLCAQKVGPIIMAEADFMQPTALEAKIL